MRSRHRLRPPLSFSPLLAGATALAVGLTAGIVVLALPSGRQPSTASATGTARAGATSTAEAKPTGTGGTAAPIAGTTRSAQLLADVAANGVLSQPAVKPGQWVYRRVDTYRAPLPSFIKPKFTWRTYNVEDTWMMADGSHFYTTGTSWG
jgi:hypothetical protein